VRIVRESALSSLSEILINVGELQVKVKRQDEVKCYKTKFTSSQIIAKNVLEILLDKQPRCCQVWILQCFNN
jgi:hypothetical protein